MPKIKKYKLCCYVCGKEITKEQQKTEPFGYCSKECQIYNETTDEIPSVTMTLLSTPIVSRGTDMSYTEWTVAPVEPLVSIMPEDVYEELFGKNK